MIILQLFGSSDCERYEIFHRIHSGLKEGRERLDATAEDEGGEAWVTFHLADLGDR
jgi:hypothetical protein